VPGGWKGALSKVKGLDVQFRHPRNIAVACGDPSGGLVVLDIDPRNGGDETLARLIATHGPLPPTLTIRTGGGGKHYWFKDTDGAIPATFKGGPGVDVLSTGSIAVCPPSVHHTGGLYKIHARDPIAAVPPWLVALYQDTLRHPASEGKTRVHLGRPIDPGSRNSELTRLAGMLVGRGAEEGLVTDVVTAVNSNLCDPPLDGDEITMLVQSVCSYGADLRMEPLNDYGNARRLVRMHGRNLRYLVERKSWLVWDGRRWAPDDDEAMRLAKTVPEVIEALAAQETVEKRAKSLLGWARSSGSKGRIESALALAQSEPGIAVHENQLDAHVGLLNTPGGIVDLRTGKMVPHDPAYLMSQITPVAPIPGPAKEWRKFLRTVLKGDSQLATFVASALGYSLTGGAQEQVVFLLWGEGSNGKSTFLEAIRYVMGNYAKGTPFDTFTRRGGDGPRNDLARLAHSRFVLATEGNENARLNEAVVKRLTGGDVITARFLFKEYFDFAPTFKLWLSTNHRPRIRGADHAIWRRIRLVPFTAHIPDSQQDKNLPAKLRGEAGEILHWLIRGARLWYKKGILDADAVDEATQQYRHSQDILGQFLEECTVKGDTLAIRSRGLYTAFRKWVIEQGEHPWSNRAFTTRMEDRGWRRKRTSEGRWWKGLTLSPDAPGADKGTDPMGGVARGPAICYGGDTEVADA
jgi:putative DNA primase/helicase